MTKHEQNKLARANRRASLPGNVARAEWEIAAMERLARKHQAGRNVAAMHIVAKASITGPAADYPPLRSRVEVPLHPFAFVGYNSFDELLEHIAHALDTGDWSRWLGSEEIGSAS